MKYFSYSLLNATALAHFSVDVILFMNFFHFFSSISSDYYFIILNNMKRQKQNFKIDFKIIQALKYVIKYIYLFTKISQ